MVLFLAAQLINLMASKLLQFDGSGGTRDNPKGGAPQKLGWMLLFFLETGWRCNRPQDLTSKLAV
jgi:hypothetical protein